MEWTNEVNAKIKRKNQILFSKGSPLLQELNQLVTLQSHRTLILWALELAEEAVQQLKSEYPQESRPTEALEISRLWAKGIVKMPEAQKKILRCHAMAKEIDSPVNIALCHAVGQACGVVHAPGHAMGFPVYELTALVRKYGLESGRQIIEKRNQEYLQRLKYWEQHEEDYPGPWAKFLQ